MERSMEKLDKFKRVARAVLKLLYLEGKSGLSYTKVASEAKVSRAWLYKYVGKQTKDLLNYSADHFGEEILSQGGDITQYKTAEALSQHAIRMTWNVMDMFANQPDILSIYFRYNGRKSPLSDKIREIENKQLKAMGGAIATVTGISKPEAVLVAEVLMAIRMGLSFRYTQCQMGKRHSKKEIQKALRRVFQHSLPHLE
jgi:hypothetical protein